MKDGIDTQFENALINLIYSYMEDGLTGADVKAVLLARMDDDFDAGHRENEASRNEAAYEREQERLMETGGGPSLLEQQIEAMKFK